MSVRTEERPAGGLVEEDVEDVEVTEEEGTPSGGERRPASPFLTCIAVFLAVFGAGWMVAGLFHGALPRFIAIVGALAGVGPVAYSYRTRYPSAIQYLTLPFALLIGALIVLPDTGGGTANLPGLVSEALRSGGIGQPPIPFDPGWRFVMVVLLATLGAAAASLSIAMNRPKVGVFMPVPLLFAAALIQPSEQTLITSGVALVLLVAALAVSYGIELAREGATSGQFEIRRFIRGGAVAAGLLAVLAFLTQVGFLFPEQQREEVIPPKRPEPPPTQPDRVLFTVTSNRQGPWRLGVLDVYDGRGWLLPPYESKRLTEIPEKQRIGGALSSIKSDPQTGESRKFTASFVINDVQGHVVPNIANPNVVETTGFAMQYDPRTQMFRLPAKRATSGMAYRVDSPAPPSGEELSEAPSPPASFSEFLEVPPPPGEVVTLLTEAPQTNAWDRLQYLRNAFYQRVVAAGSGNPVDVPPSRVAEMLAGGEATPFEITAAEGLLARWAGVPSRIGYGFYSGDRPDPSGPVFQVRPRHGSTWLEAYFHGHGWVTIVGVPPRAKANLNEAKRKEEQSVQPTEELSLIVYVPIRRETSTLLYQIVRYWAGVAAPFVLGALLIWAFFPGPVKLARRLLRGRWASGLGERARVVNAYAEFRDVANDLNMGDPVETPLEFTSATEHDDEHLELAWLVTRAIWGDLSRDLRREDAEAAEDMAQSVIRRLRRGQPISTRILSFASRASLRDPYSEEIPNLWPKWAVRRGIRGGLRKRLGNFKLLRRIRKLVPIGAALAALLFTACAGETKTAGPAGPVLPGRITPDTLGDFAFRQEPNMEAVFKKAGDASLVSGGSIHTIRKGNEILGYIEVAEFKPGFRATRREVREGVLRSIGSGRFELRRIGGEQIHVQTSSEQRLYLWFSNNGSYFELLVAKRGFEEAERLFPALLAFQRGEEAALVFQRPSIRVFDPRRGGEE